MERYQELYRAVSRELAAGKRAVVLTEARGEELVKTLVSEEDFPGASEVARQALESGCLKLTQADGALTIAEPYVPESRLIILGGGHIAVPLAEFSAKCGFSVTVADDRPTFANAARFPLADRVVCESFERCFPLLNLNRSAFVVIITRGHRHDMTCMRQVLGFETAYTGMIGSRRRVRAAMAQLAEEGFSKATLEAVRSPIGLSIGAQTPEEIAVSILSQLIEYKRLRSAGWPELDRQVLTALGEDSAENRALATIIETKGSVPRGIGAKMVVLANGQIQGSIGGGCSESAVIGTALDILRDGGHTVVDVDMTGDVAEEEGMVCGGTMRVFLEQIPGQEGQVRL